MKRRNMTKNSFASEGEVITSAAQMDFPPAIVMVVVFQDFIGDVAPLALQFGIRHLLVFVVSSFSFSRIVNYFDDGKCPRVVAGHV